MQIAIILIVTVRFVQVVFATIGNQTSIMRSIVTPPISTMKSAERNTQAMYVVCSQPFQDDERQN
jgi:hypothetical protein